MYIHTYIYTYIYVRRHVDTQISLKDLKKKRYFITHQRLFFSIYYHVKIQQTNITKRCLRVCEFCQIERERESVEGIGKCSLSTPFDVDQEKNSINVYEEGKRNRNIIEKKERREQDQKGM